MIASLAILVAGAFVLPLAWMEGADRRKSARLIADTRPECRCRRCGRIRAGIIDPGVYGPHPNPYGEWGLAHYGAKGVALHALRDAQGGHDPSALFEKAREAEARRKAMESVAASLGPEPGKPLNLFPAPQVSDTPA